MVLDSANVMSIRSANDDNVSKKNIHDTLSKIMNFWLIEIHYLNELLSDISNIVFLLYFIKKRVIKF